ncbi:MAG: HAD family hydrolase [Dehalococcoidia bacterium]|jgi:histidinol-phosphate phosphatase family protein
MHKAVFIDRDGTMARDVPYCSRPEDFELYPDVAGGIKLLKKHNFKVVVITNQSGIARGYFDEETLKKIHTRMVADLKKLGTSVDAIYYCPHHPEDNCDCRKPAPKLALAAAADLGIDLGQSYVIGDSDIDIGMARNAGCRAAVSVGQPGASTPNYFAGSFRDAVDWILSQDPESQKS